MTKKATKTVDASKENGAGPRAPDLDAWPSTTGPRTIQEKIEVVLSNGQPHDLDKLTELGGARGENKRKVTNKEINKMIGAGLVATIPHPEDLRKVLYVWKYFLDETPEPDGLPIWMDADPDEALLQLVADTRPEACR